jgi:DNA-binding IclR family transcriptional regulator
MARKAPPPLQDHGLAPAGVRSVERCIDILDLLVAQEREMTLSELATAIGAPKSTTLTVVRTLLGRGLVAYDGRSRLYRVGLGFTRFAKAQVEVDLRDIAIPHLRRLVEETSETVTLAMTDGRSVYYLCRIMGSQPLQYAIPVGSPRPMHATAAGKVLLAHFPPDQRRDYYDKVELLVLTRNTITERAALEAQLETCRRRGYATAKGETSLDVFGLAVPIFDATGEVVAAVNLGGPLSRLKDGEARYVPAVSATAQAIARDLRQLGVRLSGSPAARLRQQKGRDAG